MKTKFIKSLWLSVLFVLGLAACGASAPTLTPEMVTSMNAFADQADLQFPGDIQAGIARLCASEPTALYWNKDANIHAVTCLIPTSFDLGTNIYGVVLLDGNTNAVIHVEHINATSQSALENIIASSGWERK